LRGTNTLDYYEHSEIKDVKSFITLTPGGGMGPGPGGGTGPGGGLTGPGTGTIGGGAGVTGTAGTGAGIGTGGGTGPGGAFSKSGWRQQTSSSPGHFDLSFITNVNSRSMFLER